MDRWQGKVAVVTGASAGIGQAIAKQLASDGLIVVAVARREARLKELAASISNAKGGKIVPYVADVTKEAEAVAAIRHADSLGGVSVLVNNAGCYKVTKITDGEMENWRLMFELNVLSLGPLIREGVKSMKAHQIDGHIVNISRIAQQLTRVARRLDKNVAGFLALTKNSNENEAREKVWTSPKEKLAVVKRNIKFLTITGIIGNKLLLPMACHWSRANIFTMRLNMRFDCSPKMISPGLVDTEIFEVGLSPDLVSQMKNIPMLKSEDIALACQQVLSTPPNMQVVDYIVRPVGETIPA